MYVGGTQGPSLGTPVSVYDSLIEGGKGTPGAPVPHGTPGELVAPTAFPNMPVYLWNDVSGSRYFGAYFEKYDNVWTHGDFVMIHPVTKALLFLGRADGVLNPSGVRFGSAEIYSIIEDKFPVVADSICVGQRRPQDSDESVMLFLLMKPSEKFTAQLVNDVKGAIRKGLSARHVPKYVFETPDIPVSNPRSGTTDVADIKVDDGKSEESGAPSQADCFGEDHKTQWHVVESEILGLLLPVRKDRRSGRAEEQIVDEYRYFALPLNAIFHTSELSIVVKASFKYNLSHLL